MANVFYLIIMFLQMIDLISITGGRPVMLYPLSFVVAVSMIKDISEDYKRHKSDKKENYRKVLVLNVESGQFEEKHWEQVHVGNILKVLEGQYFPADLILLKSADKSGQCYVETKSLDGETNLKTRQANKTIMAEMRTVGEDYS
jgi:phospholipid-transporting ATPase